MMPIEPYERGTPDEAMELLKIHGRWLIAAIETSVSWPISYQVIRHDGCAFILRPQTSTLAPNVLLDLRVHSLGDDEALSRMFAFCSALAWAEKERLVVRQWMYQNMPMGMGLGSAKVVTEVLSWGDLPLPANQVDREVLALFREAFSSTNPFYSALTYYKVIERLIPGNSRGAWMNTAWPRLTDNAAVSRFNALHSSEQDVGEYIRDSIRKAIAHTNYRPFVNPDDAADWIRISKDLRLLRELTVLCIADHCNIEHLESSEQDISALLALQTGDVREILQGVRRANPGEEVLVNFPSTYTFVVRRGIRTKAVKGLEVIGTGFDKGGPFRAIALTPSKKHMIEFAIRFDDPDIAFRRHIDPQIPVSREAVVEEIEIFEASWLHTLNGHIELWNGPDCLAKGKSFIPINALPDVKWAETEANRLGVALFEFDNA